MACRRVALARPQRGWGGRGVSHPDQHFAIFVACQALGVDKFVFERCEVVVIQVKLTLSARYDTRPRCRKRSRICSSSS